MEWGSEGFKTGQDTKIPSRQAGQVSGEIWTDQNGMDEFSRHQHVCILTNHHLQGWTYMIQFGSHRPHGYGALVVNTSQDMLQVQNAHWISRTSGEFF